VIAAQTGAGKSNLLKKTQDELQHNAVFVNTDELRRFHPRFIESGQLGDDKSAERTHHDASGWRDELLISAVQSRRNIIFEGVFKDGDGLVETIGTLKESGYEVIVRFVAVHRRLSVLGVYMRYEEQKSAIEQGRFATVKYHDECYEKLLDTASKVEHVPTVDLIEVYNRATNLLFAKPTGVVVQQVGDAVRRAIEDERAREMSTEEKGAYQQGWHKVLELMKQRGASDGDTKKVAKLAEALLKEIM
jgi:predicted ABC-type ATPase